MPMRLGERERDEKSVRYLAGTKWRTPAHPFRVSRPSAHQRVTDRPRMPGVVVVVMARSCSISGI
jgi:hypothetical protein